MTADPAAVQREQQAVLALLAAATPEELSGALQHWRESDGAVDLRPAECGLVMLRGRIGGDGAAFNVGEATVTRAVVKLPSGEIGHGHRLGRDRAATRCAAIVHALWLDPARRADVERRLLDPLRARVHRERNAASALAASSRVEFFTMARGAE
jgi:alpha-D-ribose 1-methylphosphonate 5-triphosphate synthase subunit PhnG